MRDFFEFILNNDRDRSLNYIRDNVNLNNINDVLKEWLMFVSNQNFSELIQEINEILEEIASDVDISMFVTKEPFVKLISDDAIINLTGQSGSGKSTYAKEHFSSDEYLIIDTDEILSEERYNHSNGINKEIGTYLRNKYNELPDLYNNFDLIYNDILEYCNNIDKTIVIDCAQFHCIKDISILKGKFICIRTDISTCYNRVVSRWIASHNGVYNVDDLNKYKDRKKAIFKWYKYSNEFLRKINKE